MGLLGSNYCCLGFSCYCISHWGDRKVSNDTPPLLGGITLFFVFNCYLCFLHVHSVQVSFWGSSPAPLCSCFKTKKTNCHIIYNNFSIFTVVVTIRYISFCLLVKGYFSFRFWPKKFSLALCIKFFVLCKLPCKSHFIHNQDAKLQKGSALIVQTSAKSKFCYPAKSLQMGEYPKLSSTL